MGLPLFIAPVESDIKTKSPEKSISRRRNARSARAHLASRTAVSAERRALQRRAAILRESFPTPETDQPSHTGRPSARFSDEEASITAYPPPPPPPPISSARYPWIETGQPPPPEAYDSASAIGRSTTQRHSGPYTTATFTGDRIRGLLDDGYSWPSRADPPPGPPPPRFAQSPHQTDFDSFQRDRIAPEVAARFDRSPERSLRSRINQSADAIAAESRAQSRRRRLRSSNDRRTNAIDGLGDRSRSLSPEVWDTLLTTLTPDPQPPSVGSSFASASAFASASTSNSQSQSAAASSRTSIGPDVADSRMAEQPCDNSDSDYEPTDDDMFVRPDHLSSNVPSRHRRFVAALDSNENRSTSYVRGDNRDRATDANSASAVPPRSHSETRHDNSNQEDFPDYRSVVDQTRRLVELGNRLRQDFGIMLDDRQRESGERTTEDLPGDRTTTTGAREGSGPDGDDGGDGPDDTDRAAASESTRGVDDVPLFGMLRIVRSLAEREDIPDEWWAEAGLSRTIPDDS